MGRIRDAAERGLIGYGCAVVFVVGLLAFMAWVINYLVFPSE